MHETKVHNSESRFQDALKR